MEKFAFIQHPHCSSRKVNVFKRYAKFVFAKTNDIVVKHSNFIFIGVFIIWSERWTIFSFVSFLYYHFSLFLDVCQQILPIITFRHRARKKKSNLTCTCNLSKYALPKCSLCHFYSCHLLFMTKLQPAVLLLYNTCFEFLL